MPEYNEEQYKIIEATIDDLNLSQNKRILNRNGAEWYDEFLPYFTYDELYQMREYLYCHPIETEYDFNDSDHVSNLVFDYIKWWAFDLISYDGDINFAKAVLNSGYV